MLKVPQVPATQPTQYTVFLANHQLPASQSPLAPLPLPARESGPKNVNTQNAAKSVIPTWYP